MTQTPIPTTIGHPALAALNGRGLMYLEQVAEFGVDQLQYMHGIGPKAISLIEQEMKQNSIDSKPRAAEQ